MRLNVELVESSFGETRQACARLASASVVVADTATGDAAAVAIVSYSGRRRCCRGRRCCVKW